MMTLNTWVVISMQICIFLITIRMSMARELTLEPRQASSKGNTINSQSWRNPTMSQRKTGPRQPGSAFPSSISSNNQGLGAGSSGAERFSGLGKLRVLGTLFTGLRNTGLEETIAGEIIQRLMRTMLKEVIVPFKSELFQFRSRQNAERN